MKARRRAWITGEDRRESSPFLHIVRSPSDPERQDRARSLGGTTSGDGKIASFHALKKRPPAELAAEIVGLLEDGDPRTFNRIAVELWDKTADIVFDEARVVGSRSRGAHRAHHHGADLLPVEKRSRNPLTIRQARCITYS